MLIRNWKEYIEKVKKEYKKIGFVQCPAFNNEKIYFTNKGFNHLLYREGKPRSEKQQRRRMYLLKYVVDVIRSTKIYKKDEKTNLYSLSKNVGDRIVTVIICQMNNGLKVFLSVFDKKINKNTKDL